MRAHIVYVIYCSFHRHQITANFFPAMFCCNHQRIESTLLVQHIRKISKSISVNEITLFLALTSARASSMRYRTTSKCPCFTAFINGVQPNYRHYLVLNGGIKIRTYCSFNGINTNPIMTNQIDNFVQITMSSGFYYFLRFVHYFFKI